jgi:protein pelota
VQGPTLEDNGRLLRLRVETEEDLWALRSVLRPGDVVFSRTSRELKGEGRGGGRRVAMVLGVSVEGVEYQPFTDRLRIRGVIVSSPRELDLVGRHHTLSIEPGMEVAVLREGRWSEGDLRRLGELSEGASPRALAIAIDDEQFAIAVIRGNGVQVLEEGDLGLPGKGAPEERELGLRSAMGRVAADAARAASELGVGRAVVAGPAHWKDDLAGELRRIAPRLELIVDSVSYGGIKGIYELLRRDSVKEALRRAILVRELEAMERVNSVAATDPESLAYGLDGVGEAVSRGAAEEVIVDSGLVRSADREVGDRALAILEAARRTGARVVILESDHPELRAWISSLGGIVAILRYRVR